MLHECETAPTVDPVRQGSKCLTLIHSRRDQSATDCWKVMINQAP